MKRFSKHLKETFDLPHLPGFSIDLSEEDVDTLRFERERQSFLREHHFEQKACWSCGSSRAIFVTDNHDLSTLRRRCSRCFRCDQQENAVRDKFLEEQQNQRDAGERMRGRLALFEHLSHDAQQALIDKIDNTSFYGVKIGRDSPLWNMLVARML